MHNAPSVTYPVGRSRFEGRLALAIWLLGAAALATWWVQSPGFGLRHAIGALVLLGAGLWTIRAGRRMASGTVTWDGVAWSRSTADGTLTGDLQVSLDLQGLLLAHWRDPASSTWFWLDRSSRPELWGDLRRAVYSRARREALPGDRPPAANP